MAEQALRKRSVVLTDELVERIASTADAQDREFSAQARRLIKIGLDHDDEPAPKGKPTRRR